MQFSHTGCGGTCFADLTGMLKMVAQVVPGKTVLRVTSATMVQVVQPDKAIPMVWYCGTCAANVPASEVSATCEHCGGSIPAESAIKSTEGGGVYCSECSDKMIKDGDSKVTLGKSIIKKVSLNPISTRG